MTVEKRSSEATITYKITSLAEGDEFNIPYQFLEDNDYLKVAIRNQDDEFIALALDSDYEIELSDGTNGVYGVVRILKAYNDLENICIYRNIDISQEKIFDSQTIFSNTVESAFDKLTMILQDLLSIKRTIHVPIDDIVDDDTLKLPPASERANGTLYFDDMGNIKIGDFDAATKSLRQPEGEISDPTFEISVPQRSNGILAFNEKGNVKFLAIYSGGDGIEIEPNGRISVTDTFYSDPSIWTQGRLPESGEWKGICYGNGIFVAIASSTNKVVYSDTGIVWQSAELPETAEWQTICFGKGVFVAIADNGVVAYSRTGTTWYESRLPTVDTSWKSVCYGNGVFIAVGHGNMGAYSNDGINWEEIQIKEKAENWEKIVYGNGRFIAICKNGISADSTDGINWKYSTLPVELQWSAIAYGNGTFVVIAENSDICLYGNNGESWKYGTMPVDQMWSAVAYGNGIFLAIASDSDTAAFSRDGSKWTPIVLGIENFWGGIISYGHYRFVAIEKSGNATAYNASMPVQDKIEELSKPATTTTLGRVMIGDNLEITEEGRLSSPLATETAPGSVKVGRGLINDEENGLRILIGDGLQFSLDQTPKLKVRAANGIYVSEGGVGIRIGDGLNIDINGDVIAKIGDGLEFTGSGNRLIAVKKASATQLGGIKVGNGFWMEADGTLNVLIGAGTQLDDESKIAVKVGNGINIDDNGAVSANIASSSQLGSVKVGENLSITDDGTLSSKGFDLPIASRSTLGGIKIGDFLTIDSSGRLSTAYVSGYHAVSVSYISSENRFQLELNVPQLISDGLSYDDENDRIKLKPATTTTIGGVIPDGKTIIVNEDGKIESAGYYGRDPIQIRAESENGKLSYTVLLRTDMLAGDGLLGIFDPYDVTKSEISLKPATTTTLGGVIVGDNLSVDENGKLNATGGGTGKTYTGEGGVIVDNSYNIIYLNIDNIIAEGQGLYHFAGDTIALRKATTTTLGGVIVGDGLNVDNSGKISTIHLAPEGAIYCDYSEEDGCNWIGINVGPGLSDGSEGLRLNPASDTQLGGVRIGDNIEVANDGTISVDTQYILNLIYPVNSCFTAQVEDAELPSIGSWKYLGYVKLDYSYDQTNQFVYMWRRTA